MQNETVQLALIIEFWHFNNDMNEVDSNTFYMSRIHVFTRQGNYVIKL